MRFSSRAVATIGALGIALSGAVLASIPAHATAPTAEASPNTNLLDGQKVTITASNFSPNANLAVVECAGPATDGSDCDTDNVKLAPADDTGSLSGKFVVHTGPIGTNGNTCPSSNGGGCFITVVDIATAQDPTPTAAIAPISFLPAVWANKTKNLVDGQTIKVSGAGFSDVDTDVNILECASIVSPPSGCDLGNVVVGHTDANGAFQKVPFVVHTGAIGNGTVEPGDTIYIAAATSVTPTPTQEAATTVRFAKAATETTAAFHKKLDAISGKVTSDGKGVKGLNTELDKRKAGKWHKVDTATTRKNGKFIYKHIKNGRYRVKTHGNHTYKGSKSDAITAKVLQLKSSGGSAS
jgi:hypothetical protein